MTDILKKINKDNRVLVLGYFGYDSNQLDGQTIKTRSIFELLKTKENFKKVDFYDTEIFKKNKFKVFKLFNKILKYDILVYIPGRNNLKFFPLIYILAKLNNVNIHYVVVGGWLVEYLKNKPIIRKMMADIGGIYPQSEFLTLDLINKYGFKNAVTLHNFRINEFEAKINTIGEKIKIVFMARIHPLKGIEAIFKLARVLIKQDIKNVTIDLYGSIHQPYKDSFLTNLKLFNNILYKGVIQPNDIYKTLSMYDFMILPTKYYTEGFPGSILDAYMSGIPVVVSEWKYANDFVVNNKSGVIYDFDNEDAFIESVLTLINKPDRIFKMKDHAIEESKKYSQQAAWDILKQNIK